MRMHAGQLLTANTAAARRACVSSRPGFVGRKFAEICIYGSAKLLACCGWNGTAEAQYSGENMPCVLTIHRYEEVDQSSMVESPALFLTVLDDTPFCCPQCRSICSSRGSSACIQADDSFTTGLAGFRASFVGATLSGAGSHKKH
jgi:hypothetical protein